MSTKEEISIGIIVGHSYFGKGKVYGIDGSDLEVNFGYPYGKKTVCCNDVSVIE